MRSGVSRIKVKSRRRCRMISCPAAKGIRWLKPSAATESPSCTNKADGLFEAANRRHTGRAEQTRFHSGKTIGTLRKVVRKVIDVPHEVIPLHQKHRYPNVGG